MFRAYDAERERLVAVKLFKLDLPPERVHQLVAAFEQLIAAELTHPVMAVPLATGITEVSAYLAQDYVAAESLDLAIREYGPAPASDALRVAAELSGALDFAAVVNVAHGALHPRDVLLSSDETRITGIGVARALESVGVAVPVRRPYTAPERIAGSRWDRRADVFSLAALIHELLWARRIPGTGDHVADALTELPGADLNALRNVFARALADDPNVRFDTALEFVDALKAGFPGVTIQEPEARRKNEQPAVTSRQSASGSRKSKNVAKNAESADARQPHGALEAGQTAVDTKRPGDSAEREPRLPLDVVESVAIPAALHAAAPPADFDPAALDIREPEPPRFEDVDPAPAPAGAEETSPVHEQPAQEAPPISLIEETRSAVWPLVASLLIGLALGFAGGYGVGTRERPVTGTAAGTSPASIPGREATDVAIAEPVAKTPTQTEQSAEGGRQSEKAQRSADRSRQQKSGQSAARPEGRRQAASAADSRPKTAQVQTADSRSKTAQAAQGYAGKLDVDSRPTGARVFLDGRLVGTTPLLMPVVPAGEHAIRIERDGYRRWSSSIRVVAEEPNRVTAALER